MSYPDDFSPSAFNRCWDLDAPMEFDQATALAPELMTVERLISTAISILDEQIRKNASTDIETARELRDLRLMLSDAIADHFIGGVVAIAEQRYRDRQP